MMDKPTKGDIWCDNDFYGSYLIVEYLGEGFCNAIRLDDGKYCGIYIDKRIGIWKKIA